MRYRLEWTQGFFESDDLKKILKHEQYLVGNAFELCCLGWLNSKPIYGLVAL